ncbi:MAG: DNA ligase D, partial [Desulfosarcina sp.]
PDWAKTKCLHRQEFVVAGFSRPSGSRVGFGALLLGYYDDSGTLHYAGRVGTGFNQKTLRTLADRLEELRRKTAPFKDPPTGAAARNVVWVAPRLVAEVAFTQWTEDGRLRHPAFKGLREDKAPAQVLRETPVADSRQPFGAKEISDLKNDKKQSMDAKETDHVAGILLSHPDRVLYPDQGATKIDVARYYTQVAERMLPHVIGRPLTMVRCPRGRQKKCFYQKHLTEQLPDAVKGVTIEEKNKTRTYLMVEDLRGIVALVQLGALEFHPWGSRVDRLERPDRLIFDLDPGPGVDLGELVDGCRLLRQRLLELDLTGFLKTSGGKGYHIVVPLVRRSEWDKVKAFCKALAEDMTRRHPQRFIATMSKAKRNNKIFVDYLRNTRGATSVAPFSTRARPGAPVSAPLAWEELSDSLQPNDYTIENLPHRLTPQMTDPWADFFNVRQSITTAMKKELGVEGGR